MFLKQTKSFPSMASSSINSFAKHPYPSEFINVMDFVPIILLVGNYKEWKKLMLCFIRRLGMVGFIDGTFEAPLIGGKTAREMWIALERIFDPLIDVEREKLGHCLPLHVAAIKGDWESAKTFIEREPDAVKTPITGLAQTTLVVAIRLAGRHEFVKKLLEKMAPEDLALVDSRGRTALHEASIAGNVEAAKLLVQKNLILPNIQDKKGRIPLYYAADFGIREIVLYLLDVTRDDLEPKPFEDKPGVTLLYRLATSGLYDIALIVLSRYPELACLEPSPLMIISKKPSSFQSTTPLNFWQNLIYSGVPIKLENIADHHSQRDIENPADCFISGVVDVKRRLHAMFWDLAENFVPQIKHIREIKLLHHQALELVKRLCTEVVKSNFVRAPMIFTIPLIQATSFGIREIVEEILRSDPNQINFRNEVDQTIFHFAIMCRSESVFNLIYQLEGCSVIFFYHHGICLGAMLCIWLDIWDLCRNSKSVQQV